MCVCVRPKPKGKFACTSDRRPTQSLSSTVVCMSIVVTTSVSMRGRQLHACRVNKLSGAIRTATQRQLNSPSLECVRHCWLRRANPVFCFWIETNGASHTQQQRTCALAFERYKNSMVRIIYVAYSPPFVRSERSRQRCLFRYRRLKTCLPRKSMTCFKKYWNQLW